MRRISFLLVSVAVIVAATKIESNTPIGVSVVPGVFAKPYPGVLIYEASVPILFRVPVPALIRPAKATISCTTSNYICSLAKYVNSSYNTFVESAVANHPFLAKKETFKRESRGIFNFMGDIYKLLWGVATEADLDEIKAGYKKMEENEKILQESFSKQGQILAEVVKNATAYNHLYTKAVNSSINKLGAAIAEEHKKRGNDEAVLAYTTHLTMDMIYMQQIIGTLDSAISDCRNSKLPLTLISLDILENRFNKLDKDLGKFGWMVAGHLSQFLKLSLVSCVFGPESAHVKIRVPIKRRNIHFELSEIVRIPFQHYNETCEINDIPSFVAKEGARIIPITGTVVTNCDINKEGICYIPSSTVDSSRATACAKTIFDNQSTASEIGQVCGMKCEVRNSISITEVGRSMIAVTNAGNLDVHCNDGRRFGHKNLTQVGSVLIRLPCNCTVHANEIQFDQPFSCMHNQSSDEVKFLQMVPSPWSKLRSVVMQEASVYNEIEEVLDPDWQFRVPVLNISTPMTKNLSLSYISDVTFNSLHWTISSIQVWLAAVTVIVGLVVVKDIAVICGNPFRNGYKLAMPFAAFIPGASCALSISDIATIPWKLLEDLEIATVVTSALAGGFSLVLLIVLCCILTHVKKSAKMNTEVVELLEVAENRRAFRGNAR